MRSRIDIGMQLDIGTQHELESYPSHGGPRKRDALRRCRDAKGPRGTGSAVGVSGFGV